MSALADLLNEAIATASVVLILLQLDKLQLAKGFEHGLQILFSDVEMDVTNVEAVEGNGVRMGPRGFGVAGLSVLFGLCHLNNDRDT